MYSIKVLKSNLCDYNNAFILARNYITIIGRNKASQTLTKFRICEPFFK